MQKWLDDSNNLMYSTHKSAVDERFIITLKTKIYKKMTANSRKCYLSYLNKLINGYSNTYHYSISKKLINADYFA